MDTQTRLALIRSRLSRPLSSVPKPVGMHRAGHPELPAPRPIKPYARLPPTSHFKYNVYGEFQATSHNRKEWVRTPDKRKIKPCAPKRVKRVNPLTRIAEQLLMKLPRLH